MYFVLEPEEPQYGRAVTMQQPLRVGVVGLGLIGSLHARIFRELPHTELVAVCDVNEKTAREHATRLGCKAYSDFARMCASGALDAVSICTPDQYHPENALCAAQNKLHILLEKPVATTKSDALKIEAAARDAGVRLMPAHILHFDPRYAQLREAVERDEIGDIIHMYFRRTNPRANPKRLGGKVSIFHFIGVHDFEMMCCYMRARPTRAYCQMVSRVNAGIGCEDTVIATVNFDNGALGLVELCWALPDNPALGINTCASVIGTKAAGYVNILMDQGVSVIDERNVNYPDTLHWPEYNGRIQGDLKEELSHFATATLAGTPYVTRMENAIAAVSVIEACFASIKSGLPVDVH